MSTISYRTNYISHLKNEDGLLFSDHNSKVAILWTDSTPVILFNLYILIPSSDCFHGMEDPFSIEEIESTIKMLHIEKAPGPDGFNGLFIKKCWTIIKDDFLKQC
jgi:hypothetical protein